MLTQQNSCIYWNSRISFPFDGNYFGLCLCTFYNSRPEQRPFSVNFPKPQSETGCPEPDLASSAAINYKYQIQERVPEGFRTLGGDFSGMFWRQTTPLPARPISPIVLFFFSFSFRCQNGMTHRQKVTYAQYSTNIVTYAKVLFTFH